jgi:hypothetical protein
VFLILFHFSPTCNFKIVIFSLQLDKKFGPSWHVVVGEGFGFEISYELKNLMYMFFAGNLAVCAWKCS